MVRPPRNVQRSAGPWPDLTSGERERLAGQNQPVPKSDYKPTEHDRLAIRATNRILEAHHRGDTSRVEHLRPLVEEVVIQPPDTEVTERQRDRLREALGWCTSTLPDGTPCPFTGAAGALYRHRAVRNTHEARSSRKNRAAKKTGSNPTGKVARNELRTTPKDLAGKTAEHPAKVPQGTANPQKITAPDEVPLAAKNQIVGFAVIDPAVIDENGERQPIELHLSVRNLDLTHPTFESFDSTYVYESFGRIMRIRSKSGKPTTDVEINSTDTLPGPVFRVYINNDAPRGSELYMHVKQIMKLLKSEGAGAYELLPEPSLALAKQHGWYIAPTTPVCVRCLRAGKAIDKTARIERIYTKPPRAIHLCEKHASEFRMQAAKRRAKN